MVNRPVAISFVDLPLRLACDRESFAEQSESEPLCVVELSRAHGDSHRRWLNNRDSAIRIESQSMRSRVAEAILSRRSIRDGFDGRTLAREHLEEVVTCGLAAPSSKAAKPWRFHVVADREMLATIADAVLTIEGSEAYVPKDPKTGLPRPGLVSTVAESAEVLRSASAAIFVENLGAFSTSRRAVAESSYDVREDALLGYAFELIGIGAAVENMWLAAIGLGIEGVFMGDLLIAERSIQKILGIQHDLAGALVLGRTKKTQTKFTTDLENQAITPVDSNPDNFDERSRGEAEALRRGKVQWYLKKQ